MTDLPRQDFEILNIGTKHPRDLVNEGSDTRKIFVSNAGELFLLRVKFYIYFTTCILSIHSYRSIFVYFSTNN